MVRKVQASQQSSHGFIAAITVAQEAEHRRLAGELHDDTHPGSHCPRAASAAYPTGRTARAPTIGFIVLTYRKEEECP